MVAKPKHDEVIDLEWLRKSKRAALTRAEVARLYDVDPRTITAAINDGTLPSIRLGRRVLIPRERLLALLSA